MRAVKAGGCPYVLLGGRCGTDIAPHREQRTERQTDYTQFKKTMLERTSRVS